MPVPADSVRIRPVLPGIVLFCPGISGFIRFCSVRVFGNSGSLDLELLVDIAAAQAAVSGYAAHGLFLGQALVDVLLHMFFERKFVKGGAGFVLEFGGIGAGDDQNVFPAGIVLLVIAHGGLQGQGNGFLKALGKFAAESDPAVSAQCCF